MTDMLTRDQARTRLVRLGYTKDEIAVAIRGALAQGVCNLAEHTIGTVTGADIHFTITGREFYPAHPAGEPEPSITQDELKRAVRVLEIGSIGRSMGTAKFAADVFEAVQKLREDSKWETGALYADFIPAAPAARSRTIARPEWMIFERTRGGWYNRSNVFTADGSLDTSSLRKLVFEDEAAGAAGRDH